MTRARRTLCTLLFFLIAATCSPAWAGQASRQAKFPVKKIFSHKDAWVESTIRSMTLSEKVGQMIIASIEGRYKSNDDKEYQQVARLAGEGKLGGVMFLKGDVFSAGFMANRFQSLARTPLLISADMERGLAMRLEGATEFSPGMAISAAGDPALAKGMAKVIASEARAVGIHQNFAPTVDLNINPANPVINTRSFGDRIPLAIAMSGALIDGLQSNGVVATAKHFPGHGDVTVDSHHALPVLEGDRERLEAYELKPFKAAIDQGVMSVMVGHLAVPKLTGSLEPASLSKSIVTDLLRDHLGFKGLIVTDALNMKALFNGSNLKEIAVKAVEAGNDMLLFPPDPEEAQKAVVEAVENGTIPPARIDESVRRILHVKRWLGLDQERMVDLARLQERVGQPESKVIAERIAEGAVTMIRDREHLVPLKMPLNGPVLNIVLQDRKADDGADAFAARLENDFPVVHVRIDPTSGEKVYREAAGLAAESAAVIVSTGIQALPGSSQSKLSEQQLDFARRLPTMVRQSTPVVLVSLGTPYLLDAFPEIGTAICSYSSNEYAEASVVRVLKGEIAATGRLPVSLPGSKP